MAAMEKVTMSAAQLKLLSSAMPWGLVKEKNSRNVSSIVYDSVLQCCCSVLQCVAAQALHDSNRCDPPCFKGWGKRGNSRTSALQYMKVLLQCCCSVVAVLLQRCCGVVALLLQCCCFVLQGVAAQALYNSNCCPPCRGGWWRGEIHKRQLYSIWQCVAVLLQLCCSVLLGKRGELHRRQLYSVWQCCCSVVAMLLQCAAMCDSVLQSVAVCCNAAQHKFVVWHDVGVDEEKKSRHVSSIVCHSVSQCCCSVLQCCCSIIAVWCSVLQRRRCTTQIVVVRHAVGAGEGEKFTHVSSTVYDSVLQCCCSCVAVCCSAGAARLKSLSSAVPWGLVKGRNSHTKGKRRETHTRQLCSVWQCCCSVVAVLFSVAKDVLQCCCSVDAVLLQCVAVWKKILHVKSTRFSAAMECSWERNTFKYISVHHSTLRHTATHCNTLRHTATHCDTLRHTATR